MTTKRWSAVATVARTKELKKRYGAEEGEEIITSGLERALSRERLFLSARKPYTLPLPSQSMGREICRGKEVVTLAGRNSRLPSGVPRFS